MSGKTLIPFAIRDTDQQIVSVEEVESGLGCQCHCPSCHGVLIARKGQHKAHHFSHHKGSERDCAFAFETSIRLMLLDKLDRINSLSTPALRIDDFHKPVCTGKTLAVSHVPSSGPAEGPRRYIRWGMTPNTGLAFTCRRRAPVQPHRRIGCIIRGLNKASATTVASVPAHCQTKTSRSGQNQRPHSAQTPRHLQTLPAGCVRYLPRRLLLPASLHGFKKAYPKRCCK